MLPALHVVNERLGYVRSPAVVEIAALLGLAPAQVQDTLSFYGFFPQDRPVGTTASGCAARSVARPAAARSCWTTWRSGWAFSPGETTADGRVTLEFAECLGACDGAPAMLINDTLHEI